MSGGECGPLRKDIKENHPEAFAEHHESLKFGEFGWGATNSESRYCMGSMVGNWSEERYDINYQKRAKCLPSEFDHYYQSTYGDSYNIKKAGEVPKYLRNLKRRESYAFPTHQPELDSTCLRRIYNTFNTNNRLSYQHPRVAAGLEPPHEKVEEQQFVCPPTE